MHLFQSVHFWTHSVASGVILYVATWITAQFISRTLTYRATLSLIERLSCNIAIVVATETSLPET